MAFLKPISQEFMSTDNWTGHTYGELKEALMNLAVATLLDTDEKKLELAKIWEPLCEPNIDYLLFMQMSFMGISAGSEPYQEWLKDKWDRPLDSTSKQNLFSIYLNTHFYKYIETCELKTIHVIQTKNPSLSLQQAIDFYITQLLYFDTVKENPGRYFTYEQLENVSASRKQSLKELSGKLSQALADEDKHTQFECIFMLMTWYTGSNYRRVHDAVTTILGIDMAEFRERFFQHIDRIIKNEGAVHLKIADSLPTD